ncbi:MAG TPA: acetamidase/formamidase family protein [Anaerolineales bacterium]|nr:acetamidase/formamidase family protein [Anaerolineales bacterium]
MIHLRKNTSTYTFSPENPPAIKVEAGTTLLFETLDALNEQIQSDADSAAQIDLDHVNAATGPVYIHGAKPGDTLVAEILDIKVSEMGSAEIIPGFGFLQDSIPGPYTKTFHLEKDRTFKYGESIRIGLKPMIGTIGVAPLIPITTLSSGIHGGNLDTTDIRVGSKVYLPVLVEGALFGVGDVHATMGDGEVCGTGIECGAEVTIRLDLLPNHPIPRPRIETDNEWMCVASAEGLENAIKLALRDMVDMLRVEHHLSAEEAYVLVSLVGDVRIGQVVDPMVTVRVAVPKQVFIKNV